MSKVKFVHVFFTPKIILKKSIDYDTHGNGTSDQTNPHKHQQNGE